MFWVIVRYSLHPPPFVPSPLPPFPLFQSTFPLSIFPSSFFAFIPLSLNISLASLTLFPAPSLFIFFPSLTLCLSKRRFQILIYLILLIFISMSDNCYAKFIDLMILHNSEKPQSETSRYLCCGHGRLRRSVKGNGWF